MSEYGRYHRRRRLWVRIAVAAVIVLAVVLLRPAHGRTGRGPSPEARTGPSPSRTAGPGPFAAPIGMDQALAEARATPVAAPHPGGYSRDRMFGGKWARRDDMCGYANTRDYVLRRDLRDPVLAPGTCHVVSGLLEDRYTGRDVPFRRGAGTSADVQIDHVVAVHDAWASGLYRPDRAGDRTAYYNDPEVLQASEGGANQDKGDGMDWSSASDPVWLPPNRAWRCDYMAKRVYIKHKYALTMDEAERRQTVALLEGCAARAR